MPAPEPDDQAGAAGLVRHVFDRMPVMVVLAGSGLRIVAVTGACLDLRAAVTERSLVPRPGTA